MSDIVQTAPKISKIFNASDSDVTILSCDGTIFKLHKKYLEATTGAFPPAETPTRDEVVALTETSETLELLFQFVCPRRHPELDDVAFHVLSYLAEAAEKYEVFSAIGVCKIWMKRAVSLHVPEVLAYAAKHDYKALLDEAAPLAVFMPLHTVATLLTPDLILPWLRYYEIWNAVYVSAFIAPIYIPQSGQGQQGGGLPGGYPHARE